MGFLYAVKAMLQLFAKSVARCFDKQQNLGIIELGLDHFDVRELIRPMHWLLTAVATLASLMVVTKNLAFVTEVLGILITHLPIRECELAVLKLG